MNKKTGKLNELISKHVKKQSKINNQFVPAHKPATGLSEKKEK